MNNLGINRLTIANNQFHATCNKGKGTSEPAMSYGLHIKSRNLSAISNECTKLNNNGDILSLSTNLPQQACLAFKGKQIYNTRINSFINKCFKKKNKPLEIDFEHSKTIDMLFSPRFAPKQHINRDGYYVTTVIDKKTGEPVEAYVKKGKPNKTDKSYLKLDNTLREKWEIYVKNFWGQYKLIGYRKFGLDYNNNKVDSGYMDSKRGNYKYSGIGVRLHQIAVERMIKNQFENVEIYSSASAFPFHYKCGFRTSPSENYYSYKDLKSALLQWSKALNIPASELKERVVIENKRSNYFVDNKAIEEIKKDICRRHGKKAQFNHTTMMLNPENLKRWVERAKSQPILLDNNK